MAGFADLFSGGYRPQVQGLGAMPTRFVGGVPPGAQGMLFQGGSFAPQGVPFQSGGLPPGLMRLAGDVVQMPMGGQLDAIRRLIQPGVNPGAQGNLSINQLGPRQLDLLNILRYPGGGQMLPPLGGRRGDLMPPMRGEEFA